MQTVGDLLERYLKNVTPRKRARQFEATKLRLMLADNELANTPLTKKGNAHVVAFRDRRAPTVGDATIIRELVLLGTVFNHARQKWGLDVENPVKGVARPRPPATRDRRLLPREEQWLFHELRMNPRTGRGTYGRGGIRNPWIASMVCLAIETAMRRGELLALRWRDVRFTQGCFACEGRMIPMTGVARAVVEELRVRIGNPTPEQLVFLTTEEAVKLGFARTLKRARANYLAECKDYGHIANEGFLTDLHFNDLRHEAISRIAAELPLEKKLERLQEITGHRDPTRLHRYV